MHRRLLLALCLMPLVQCAGGAANLTYDLRWVGTVTPEDQAACGAPTPATLTRRSRDFTFTPNDGALVITGTVDPDGHLHGSLPLIGADHHPFPLEVDGTLTRDGFRGVYTTPRCHAQVRLHPPA